MNRFNWKTTAGGIISILVALVAVIRVSIGEGSVDEAWPLIAEALAFLGIGGALMYARDAD